MIKSIMKIFAIILAVKFVFFVGGIVNKNKAPEKPNIEKFVNEFVINNPQLKYPIRVDSVSTLMGRTLIKKDDIYFIVEELQMNVARETFTIRYQEVGEMLKKEALPKICKHFKEERESLFKGYSQVGLIQKFVDANNKHVAEVQFHISDC